MEQENKNTLPVRLRDFSGFSVLTLTYESFPKDLCLRRSQMVYFLNRLKKSGLIEFTNWSSVASFTSSGSPFFRVLLNGRIPSGSNRTQFYSSIADLWGHGSTSYQTVSARSYAVQSTFLMPPWIPFHPEAPLRFETITTEKGENS